jgi:hypothetical protein
MKKDIITDWLQKPITFTEMWGVSILCAIPLFLVINW